MYEINSDSLDLITSNEGFSAYRYKDGIVGGVQMYSIGYGHQIKSGEVFSEPISKDTAREILFQDLVSRANALNDVLPPGLNSKQFAALLDYTMSFSPAQVYHANLFKKIKAGAPRTEIENFWLSTYITAAGTPGVNTTLKKRREKEVEMFFASNYPIGNNLSVQNTTGFFLS